MRITEVTNAQSSQQLAALSQFLIARADDNGTEKSMALPTFIELARDLGVSVTADSLKNMIQRPPLSNLIQDVQGDDQEGRVVFKGDNDADADTMTVDQARDTVDRMAKRAASPVFK
jgi:hypothetical protein